MKYFATALVSAAILAAATTIAGAATISPGIMKSMGNIHLIATCNTGFKKGTYAGANPGNFSCTTPYIKCPKSQDKYVLALIYPQRVVRNSRGVRFAYRCEYATKPR